MKICVIYCAYNCESYLDDSLQNWISRDDCIISAVSVPFKEYSEHDFFEDNTTLKLKEYYNNGDIAYLETKARWTSEHVARNWALIKVTKDYDYVWLVDGDEIYSQENIDDILAAIQDNPDYAWYSLSLKNYVFDKQHFLKDAFTPPRIFRANYNHLKLGSFYHDNDLAYSNKSGIECVDYKGLPNYAIGQDVAWVDHYSWLNDEIGKRKVAYQLKHFGHCSFLWDNGLKFDSDFFAKNNLNIPEIMS